MSSDAAERQKKLDRFLVNALRDDNKINTPRQGKLFVEALCSQDDVVLVADNLLKHPQGLQALSRCVRYDLSLEFINGPATQLLTKLSDPSLANIDSGMVLLKVLQSLLKPAFFWSACIHHLKLRALNSDAMQQVAWILAETLRLFPAEEVSPYIAVANDREVVGPISDADSAVTRSFGHKIAHYAMIRSDGGKDDIVHLGNGPGGRHDNDPKKIQDIKLLPTHDEILSAQPAFLRTATEVFSCADPERRYSLYIDNMFRLLRDDLVHDFKEKLQGTPDRKPTRQGHELLDASLSGVEFEDVDGTKPWQRQRWAVCFKSSGHIPGLANMKISARKNFLESKHSYGQKIMRHGSLVAVCLQDQKKGQIAGFGYVRRDTERLSLDTAELLVRLEDSSAGFVLQQAASGMRFNLRQIDTAVFAYEPFLNRLQRMARPELCDVVLGAGDDIEIQVDGVKMNRLVQSIQSSNAEETQRLLPTQNPLHLDDSQRAALLSGLCNRVSLIQGPPGTGKSFIGALIARALHDNLSGTMMVICFTNHALDQFTEDLMDIGIPTSSIVRLGSKSSARTESLLLRRQQHRSRLAPYEWREVNEAGDDMRDLESDMRSIFQKLTAPTSNKEILPFLEFHDDTQYYEALHVPQENDSLEVVDSKGKAIRPDYLLKRWLNGGNDAGALNHLMDTGNSSVWKLSNEARHSLRQAWLAELRQQCLDDLLDNGRSYNQRASSSRDVFRNQDAEFLSKKKIIACTSTYAAMSADIFRRVNPETVLLEEAGELLEQHVLTAISDRTKRLIMIGDPKQLRPKVSNYSLTVENGNGYDLNRSMFERLIMRGFPDATLSEQHRMRSEISEIVRHLTYPHLTDANSTLNRPSILGLQKDVVFVDHREPEVVLERIKERQSGTSKQNPYEALLALRYVKYLAQQGYGSEDIVVLTPYLGQLRELQDKLSRENDPVLNDLDSHDLFSAGLLSSEVTRPKGSRVHISSIDNYQGEESKIVIVSLTRSNSAGDIGFMSQMERVNVMLSRARDGLIVIGNLSTFTSSKSGGKLWTKLTDHIKERGFIHQGLPTQCQSHQDVKNTVVAPDDFQVLCPDGGCSRPCPETLPCGQHKCPSKCHILVDHSKIICREVVTKICPQGHKKTWSCQSKPDSGCITCNKLNDKRRKIAKAKLEQTQKEEADQRRHDEEMEGLDEEMALIRQEMANLNLKDDRARALAAKQKDLEKTRAQRQKAQKKESPAAKSKAHTDPETQVGTHESPVSPEIARAPDGMDVDNHSAAQIEWARQKQVENQTNDAIDKLMNMVGLEQVKHHILNTKDQIDLKKRQGINLAGERFHVAFLGNPGTGKTTVARLWAELLYSLEVIPGDAFEETTGSKLGSGGVQQAQAHIDSIVKANGGVMFVDEAYQLTNGVSAVGRQVLDFLLGEIENRRGTVVFVFAGYKQPMEQFYAHNPGIPSRIPRSFEFVDYSQSELLKMLQNLFNKRFNQPAKVEGGLGGLHMKIVTKRLSRQREQEGFGNMRDLENIFSRICERQAQRIRDERRQGQEPDDFFFAKEDLIGPEPSNAVKQSPAWSTLQSLIGLQAVKESVGTLVSMLKTNYLRELEEKEPIQVSLNKVFLGSPGTGKTSVAKLYGRLLADIGLLSKGDVVNKTPPDFIGSVLGASEQATNSILESSKGKVLIIDEAYMLNPSHSGEGAGSGGDPYREAVIDTIVSKVHNVPGDDRCVLLLGYEEQLESMFECVNPGFSRRFPLADAFRFEDFTDEELRQVLRLKLQDQDLSATVEGEETALGILSRKRNLMNFGNAGEVENLISTAKVNRQKRMTEAKDGSFELDAIDFDPNYMRAASASGQLSELFKDHIGSNSLITQLREYQNIAANVKKAGLRVEDHVPFNFVFKGPPGTGKTTSARKIGRVYHDMGLLERVEVVESSVSDLVAEFVGQTGPKTEKQLQRGLGKVLFVDEAYRLGEGQFATEAVNQLTDLLTKPGFKGKLVVVLAGYETEMDRLISVNPGLASRFPETVMFQSLTPSQCMTLFSNQLKQNRLSCSSFDDYQSLPAHELLELFDQLAQLKFWGNGRDVQNISKKAMRYAFGRESHPSENELVIPHQHVLGCLRQELTSRLKSEGGAGKTKQTEGDFDVTSEKQMPHQNMGPLKMKTKNPDVAEKSTIPTPAIEKSIIERPTTEQVKVIMDEENVPTACRDAGVSDATWEQLQRDAAALSDRTRRDESALLALLSKTVDTERVLEDAEDKMNECEVAVREGRDPIDDSDDSDTDDEAAEARRRRLRDLEAARLRRAQLLEERDRFEMEAKQEKARQEEEKRQERVAQKKLREMGVCVVGYRWIKQGEGYRCAGGSHFISNIQLSQKEDK